MSAVLKKITRDYKLSTRLMPVFTLAPELEHVCSRLADFVGERFMGERDPLIVEMLRSGLDAFRRARKDAMPHVAFMQGLFQPAYLVYARRYVARQGDRYQVWSPMFEPLPVFEARHEGMVTSMVDERCPENVTPRSAAFQLAARALSGENFRLYFEDYDVAHCYPDCEAVAG